MFTAEDVHALLRARPFVPFRLHLSDGEHVDILSPETAFLTRRQLIVGILEPNSRDQFADRWRLVSFMHITQAEMLTPGNFPGAPPATGSESPSPVS